MNSYSNQLTVKILEAVLSIMSVHEEAFEEFMDRISSSLGDSVNQVILFGSVARGEETEESDVDVIVVVDDRDLKEEVFDVSFGVTLDYDVYISPKVVGVEEYRILKQGSFFRSIMDEAELYGAA